MSEIDNLESLSNGELRKKCMQHGLPNVPVTASSRNILLKKLRASMSGTPSSQQQKSQRRETIHVSKATDVTVSTEETKAEPERRTPSRGANRRTIAGTPTFETQQINENQPSNTVVAAPIGTRRRSTRDQELPISQKSHTSSKSFNPVIILESDEEDQDLLTAVEQVEQRSKPPTFGRDVDSRPSSRSGSLPKPSVATTSYNQGIAKPLVEMPEISTRRLASETLAHEDYRPQISTLSSRYTLHSPFARTTNIASIVDSPSALHSRYSTSNLTSYHNPKATPLYNEQSDDNEEETKQGFETPFLSTFARKLERLKSDGVEISKANVLGDVDFASPHRLQRSKRYEIAGRRPAKDSVTDSFRQLLIALDRKYNLRLYLLLTTIFLILVFIYVMLFQ